MFVVKALESETDFHQERERLRSECDQLQRILNTAPSPAARQKLRNRLDIVRLELSRLDWREQQQAGN